MAKSLCPDKDKSCPNCKCLASQICLYNAIQENKIAKISGFTV